MLRVMNPEIGLILETSIYLSANREKKVIVDVAAGGLREVSP